MVPEKRGQGSDQIPLAVSGAFNQPFVDMESV